MQRCIGRNTSPPDRPCIKRNFGLIQHNIHLSFSLLIWYLSFPLQIPAKHPQSLSLFQFITAGQHLRLAITRRSAISDFSCVDVRKIYIIYQLEDRCLPDSKPYNSVSSPYNTFFPTPSAVYSRASNKASEALFLILPPL